jgi:hypothetical protein
MPYFCSQEVRWSLSDDIWGITEKEAEPETVWVGGWWGE